MTEEQKEIIYKDIYIQFGENMIGTEICLRKWQSTPFKGAIKYSFVLESNEDA